MTLAECPQRLYHITSPKTAPQCREATNGSEPTLSQRWEECEIFKTKRIAWVIRCLSFSCPKFLQCLWVMWSCRTPLVCGGFTMSLGRWTAWSTFFPVNFELKGEREIYSGLDCEPTRRRTTNRRNAKKMSSQTPLVSAVIVDDQAKNAPHSNNTRAQCVRDGPAMEESVFGERFPLSLFQGKHLQPASHSVRVLSGSLGRGLKNVLQPPQIGSNERAVFWPYTWF